MIKQTKRGLLITRFWYIREVDPQTVLLTGLTRDGVFLIEKGEITKPVCNFRFNESPVAMLNKVVALGLSVRAYGEESIGLPISVPTLAWSMNLRCRAGIGCGVGLLVMRDLYSLRWMWVKVVLFLAIGVISSALYLDGSVPGDLRIAVLLVLAIWSFCRAYYFAFYVIEHYVDPSFRFSGLWSVLRHDLDELLEKEISEIAAKLPYLKV